MEDLVLYDEALEMKDIGFDEPCFGFFTYKRDIRRYINHDGELNNFQCVKNSSITMGDGWCAAPTYAQCFRWFRKNYKLTHSIYPEWDCSKFLGFEGMIQGLEGEIISNEPNNINEVFVCFNSFIEPCTTYEEAELACLQELIKIVKNKLDK